MPVPPAFVYHIRLVRVRGSRNREHGEEEMIRILSKETSLRRMNVQISRVKGLTKQDVRQRDQQGYTSGEISEQGQKKKKNSLQREPISHRQSYEDKAGIAEIRQKCRGSNLSNVLSEDCFQPGILYTQPNCHSVSRYSDETHDLFNKNLGAISPITFPWAYWYKGSLKFGKAKQ